MLRKALEHLAHARSSVQQFSRSRPLAAARICRHLDEAVKAITFPAACMRCIEPASAVLIHEGEPLCSTHALEQLGADQAPTVAAGGQR